MKGAHPLQNPRSHPTLFSRYWMRRWFHSISHCSCYCGGEGGDSKSRGGSLRAPARGPSPLAPSRCAGHPMKGAHPLQNPRSHPTLFSRYWMRRWFHSISHCSCYCGGEGGIRTHGPLPVNGFRDRPIRPLSHLSAHQDSSAKPAAQSRAASIIQIRKRDRPCFRNVYRLTFVLNKLSKIWPFR